MNTWAKKLVCGFLTVLILGTVSLPLNYVLAQGTGTGEGTVLLEEDPQTATPTGSGYAQSQSGLPICVFSNVDLGTFEGCFVRLFYYAILYPSAWIAGIAGQVFDYFIAYTLSSESYQSGGFVEKGWKVIRDIANASFIFVLLYIAITFVLNVKTQGAPKLLVRVILIAIVINFSLFFTRIIIDAGNIIARVFYEKIIVENDDLGAENNYTTLSAGIMGYVKPQKILSNEVFSQNTLGVQSNTTNALNDVDSGSTTEQIGSGFLILIILIASAINIALAWIFFSVSIFFIGRTLGLWIMMIMSPIAFASVSIPVLGSKLKQFGFNEWLQETAKLSFMAVIFMFFLFLTIMFLDIAFETVFDLNEGSTMQKIMAVIVPFGAVMFLLVTSKNQAKSMSGDFGKVVGEGIKYAVTGALGAAGLGLGLAAVGTGVLGRQIGGRLGKNMADSANTRNWRGRAQKKFGNYMSKSSWDARNIKVPKPIGKLAGLGRSGLSYATDKAVDAGDFNLTNLGTGSSKNYSQLREDRIKKIVAESKEFGVDENASLTTSQTSYTHVDASGRRSTRTINPTNISLSQAEAQVEERQRILDNEIERVHRDNDYESKKQELDDKQKEHEKEIEKQKKDLDSKEKTYKEMVAEKQSGNGSITDADIARVRGERDRQKLTHDTEIARTKDDLDTAKRDVERVEVLYRDKENELAQAKATAAAASRAFSNENAQVLNNYADSVDSWAAFPDAGLTHRYGANRDAATEIRNTANRQRR